MEISHLRIGDRKVETLFDDGFVGSITFGGGRFLAFGGQDDAPNSTKVAWSIDDKTWKELTDYSNAAGRETGARFVSSVYQDGVFVMTDRQGNASYSTDVGEHWTKIENTQFNGDTITIMSICYGKGKFVIAGGSGRIAYSIPEKE